MVGTWAVSTPFLTAAKLGVDRETGLFMATMVVQGQKEAFPVRALSNDALLVLGSGRNLGSTIEITGAGKDERLDLFGMKLRRK